MTKLIEQRAALVAAVESATDAVATAKARSAGQRYGSDAGVEVTADLREFDEAIRTNRPNATAPEHRAARHLELTKQLGEAVVEAGLVFQPTRTASGFGLAVVDPSVAADFDAALAAKSDATGALRAFDRDHGEELRAERKAAEADAIRTALESDDPDAIRAALERRAESERDAREATADDLVSGKYAGWEDSGEIRRSGTLGALTTAG